MTGNDSKIFGEMSRQEHYDTSQDCVFSGYHPLVNLLYFAAVILFTVGFLHPGFLLISFTGSIVFGIILQGKKIFISLCFSLPVFLFVIVINIFFGRQGITPLLFINGHIISFESVVYGALSGGMLVTVLLWFNSLNIVLTTDKSLYILGKKLPYTALMITTALRFIPRFMNKAKQISGARKLSGNDPAAGNIKKRAKNGMSILSALVTYSLENSIQTADSMKARGYDKGGRTSYSLYRHHAKDITSLVVLLALIISLAVMFFLRYSKYTIFPAVMKEPLSLKSILCLSCYFLLCFYPTFLEFTEVLKWHKLKSKT